LLFRWGLLGISSEASHLAEIYTQLNSNFTFIINIISWFVFALAMALFAKNWFTSEVGDFITVIFYFTSFLFLLFIFQYKYFKAIKLNMVGWAYIFPVASYGLAAQTMYQVSQQEGYLYLSIAVLSFNILFAIFLLSVMSFKLSSKNNPY